VNTPITLQRPLPLMAGRIARIAFYATLVLLPFRSRVVLLARPNDPIFKDYTDFLLFLPDITLFAALLVWAYATWMERKPVRFGPAYMWIPLTGLSIAGLLSVIFSVDRALSLYHAIRFGLLFLFYLYVVNGRISILEIGLAIGVQGTLQSIVAIGQSVSQRSVGLQAFGEYDLDPLWSGVSIVSDGSMRFLRAYGLTDHPNILGGCLAFGLLAVLGVYLHGEPARLQWIAAIMFASMSLALLLTFSRASWLSFITGTGLVVVLEARAGRRENLKSMIRLGIGTSMLLIPFIVSNRGYLGARLNAGDSFEDVRAEAQSMDERLFLNQTANRIFARHPLTGVGLSASPVAMKMEFPEFPTYYQPPHFTLLAAAVETGIVGAMFYFLLMVLPWMVFLRRRNLWTNPNVIGAAGLLLAVTVVGFFDYYTWFSTAGRLWQWLAWGLFPVAMEASG
jgi:O-antigen ligase